MKNIDINSIAELRPSPFLRICPKLNLHPKIIELFKTDYLYIEEKSLLSSFILDNFLDFNNLNNKIYKNYTVLDIIKIQRIFKYINICYRVFIKKSKDIKNQEKLLLSSVVPIFSRNFLKEIFIKTFDKD
ncbi:hypothetical protein [Acinetobacter schindleri]|uniref:hypothetical protein n=1 Tax=Acinetobacter schindleri TaxID=108981 RepID=UPI003342160F